MTIRSVLKNCYYNAIRLAMPSYKSMKRRILLGNHRNLKKLFNYEPFMDEVFRAALVTKDGGFVDVGANIGQTMLKILSLDPDRQYIGFEPQLDCCYYIDRFIRKNRLEKYAIFPFGLSSRKGVLKLLKRIDGFDGTASTIAGFRPDDFYKTDQTIYVTTGDDILKELSLTAISAIKIDVEGAELEVLEGIESTLQCQCPFVFFEVLNNYVVATGSTLDEEIIDFRRKRNERLAKLLQQHGYTIFNIQQGNSMLEIREFRPEVSSDLSITNYVAIHDTCKDGFFRNYTGTIVPLPAVA